MRNRDDALTPVSTVAFAMYPTQLLGRGIMQIKRAVLSGLVIGAILAASGCSGRSASETGDAAKAGKFSATTAPAVGEAGPVSWALFRATNTLDPIRAFDSPEQLPLTAMCETLLQQQPDLSIKAGLATSAKYVDDHTLVLELRDDATFWDGSPVTADDVAYSLERSRSSELGGYFSAAFTRVSSITATAAHEVTIALSEPDYWLRSTLSAMPGVVVQKAFAEAAGKNFGNPGTGVLCSGPFTLRSWSAGGDVVVERNKSYWNKAKAALVPSVTFTPVSNDANLAAAFKTGDIDGYYVVGSSVYKELRDSGSLNVTSGPSLITDLLAVADPKGPLADLRLREALSLAIDRHSYIQQVYSGEASLPASMSSPGTWGYSKPVFKETLGAQPPLAHDVAKAKKLVSEAGAKGKTVTMAVASGIIAFQAMSTTVKEALESIGLKLELKTVSLDKYNEMYFNPEARAGIDIFPSINNPIAPEPAPFLGDMAMPGGAYNFLGWSDDKVTQLLDLSRRTADDDERARLVAQADERITAGLPQIPMAQPYNVLYLNKKLTGAPASYSYAAGEWANLIGKAAK